MSDERDYDDSKAAPAVATKQMGTRARGVVCAALDLCAHHAESTPNIDTYTKFDDMGLNDLLLRGIYAYGFEKPSAIQQKAIVPLAKGRDVIAQAQSGTGKTGCFAVGTLEQIDPKIKVGRVGWQRGFRWLCTDTGGGAVLPGADLDADARVGDASAEGRAGYWLSP